MTRSSQAIGQVQLASQKSALCTTAGHTAAKQKITMITLQPAFCLCVLLLAKTAHRVGHGNVQLSSAVNDGLECWSEGQVLRKSKSGKQGATDAAKLAKKYHL